MGSSKRRYGAGALGIAATVVINLFAFLALWNSHQGALAEARQRASAQAYVHGVYAERALSTYDEQLVDLALLLRDDLPQDQIRRWMVQQKDHHRELLNIHVFDADGRVTLSTADEVPDLSDRPYFFELKEGHAGVRFVDEARQSRIQEGRWFFALSRRLDGPDGSFAGAVAATIDLQFLSNALKNVSTPNAEVSLVHDNGTLLVGLPDRQPGQPYLHRALMPPPGGQRDGDRTDDTGREQLFSGRSVPGYPLAVVAALPLSDAMAQWRSETWAVLLADGAVTALLVLLAAALARRDREREADLSELEHSHRAVEAAKQRAEDALGSLARTQENLLRSQKLAALGGLVAGIAHEVNTPVGNAMTGASHLDKETTALAAAFRDQTLTAEMLQDYLDTAQEASRLVLSNCGRAAELIRGFKQVAVDQASGERRVFDLRGYLDEVLLSLRPMLKKAPVRVEVDCPDGLMLDTYPGALSQIVTNLVSNALMHAFEPGQAGCIRMEAGIEGERVRLVFRDDGRGIPAELQGQVFDPFFTTRRGTGGSGLGLNIVHNLVCGTLGGAMTLDSAPGRGTAFIMDWPRTAVAAPADKETAE